jgi:release factor glutamine methyltransferase
MQLLVAKQLGCTRIELYLQFDRPLADHELAPLRELLKRRGDGTPLQHLLGSIEFHRREFRCDPRALVPRPETEELAELVLKLLPAPAAGRRLLDMGCGSGVLGLTLAAERPAAHATLADIAPDALALARDNAAALAITNVNFIESDLFAAIDGRFDLIAANLPYVPETERPTLAREVAHDPPQALFGGPDGLAVLRRFIPAAATHLAPGATLALEIGHDQASHVAALLQQCGLAEITIHRDLSGIPRFPTARQPL